MEVWDALNTLPNVEILNQFQRARNNIYIKYIKKPSFEFVNYL